MSILPDQLKKPRNLAIAGAAAALIAAGAFATFGTGGNKLAAANPKPSGFSGEPVKSTAGAPNVKSDYQPSGEPAASAPKMTATKNNPTSVAVNTKNPGNAGDNPIDVIAYGSAGAPVTIIEYGSFTCSHCAKFHEEVLPKLKERYIDTGQVRLVFRPFFLNAFDIDAGLFVACLAPGRRTAWVNLLFHQQAKWVPFGVKDALAARSQVRNALAAYSAEAGISPAEFDRCLANEANKGWLQAIHDQGIKDGLEGTPTFLVDGRLFKYRSLSIDEFSKELEPLIAKSR